jgi:hypothetical protein
MTLRARILSCVAGLAGLLTAMLVSAVPASANEMQPDCTAGHYGTHCVWWGQSYNGAHAGFDWAQCRTPDYNVFYYPSNGTGHGERIGNNNGSDQNGDIYNALTLYYDPNYAGYTVTLSPYGISGWEKAGSQLGHLLNNLRSSKFC